MNAVISIKGSQYLVKEGDVIEVNNYPDFSDKSKKIDVLMAYSDKETVVGKPVLDNVTVKLSKIEDKKGPKVRTFKFKAKSRYRKTTGFRPKLTVFKVASITLKNSEK